MINEIRSLYDFCKNIGNQDLSKDEKIALIENKIIESEIPELTFRTFSFKYGLPRPLKITAEAIIDWCLENNNFNPIILRLGNGPGKDLLIQKLLLIGFRIKPSYYLVDYDQAQNDSSANIDPDLENSLYFIHDLFKPLSESSILKDLTLKIDIIDCQEVLHEIMSEPLGGNYQLHKELLEQCFKLLAKGGVLILDDVNIIDNATEAKVQFTLSDEYKRLFKKFVDLMGIESEIVENGSKFECGIRWFTVFCYKAQFVDQTSEGDVRELKEIHKNLTKDDWNHLLSEIGFKVTGSQILPPPENLEERLKNNITIDPENQSLPPFSIHIVAQKTKNT